MEPEEILLLRWQSYQYITIHGCDGEREKKKRKGA